MDALRARVASLEKSVGRFDSGGTGKTFMQWIADRVDALESSIAEELEAVRELDRHALWHATRDAVLPAVYAEATNHSMGVAEVLHDAAAYADAAHGPLEAKAAVETYNMTAAYVAEVEALVKAALRVRDDYAGGAHVSLASAAAMELALKPFEAVQP